MKNKIAIMVASLIIGVAHAEVKTDFIDGNNIDYFDFTLPIGWIKDKNSLSEYGINAWGYQENKIDNSKVMIYSRLKNNGNETLTEYVASDVREMEKNRFKIKPIGVVQNKNNMLFQVFEFSMKKQQYDRVAYFKYGNHLGMLVLSTKNYDDFIKNSEAFNHLLNDVK